MTAWNIFWCASYLGVLKSLSAFQQIIVDNTIYSFHVFASCAIHLTFISDSGKLVYFFKTFAFVILDFWCAWTNFFLPSFQNMGGFLPLKSSSLMWSSLSWFTRKTLFKSFPLMKMSYLDLRLQSNLQEQIFQYPLPLQRQKHLPSVFTHFRSQM